MPGWSAGTSVLRISFTVADMSFSTSSSPPGKPFGIFQYIRDVWEKLDKLLQPFAILLYRLQNFCRCSRIQASALNSSSVYVRIQHSNILSSDNRLFIPVFYL